MAGDIRVYDLDQIGVVVDTSPIGNPDGQLTKAQNAIADPIGEQGSIRKRTGLKKFNSTAGAGSIQGGVSVPINLGSAGPNIQNPYTDVDITLTKLLTPIYTSTNLKIGATFDDNALALDFDWNFDFEELDDLEDPDMLDLVDDGQIDGGSSFVPLTLVGDTNGNWWVTIKTDASDHADNLTTRSNLRLLPFPTGSLRSGLTGYSVAGGAGTAALTGYPAAILNNVIYYAAGSYTTGTDAPPLRAFDGFTDRIVLRIPKNTDVSTTSYPTRIVSVVAANGVLYLATQDGGTPSANTAVGSVYQFNPSTGVLKKLGSTFATDQLPYSLLYAYGRLWCGTASNNASAKLRFIRPDIDTDWTDDHTFAAGEAVVSGLAPYTGLINIAILNRTVSGTARLSQRDCLGAYSDVDTGTIDTNAGHVAWRGYHTVVVWPTEDSGITSPSPAVFAVRQGCTEDTWPNLAIRKGPLYSSVKTDANLGPRLVSSPAINGSSTIVPVLWNLDAATAFFESTDGSTWTDRAAQLTITPSAQLPGLVIQV